MEDYKMGKTLNQEKVIEQFKEKHGDKYEYDKVIYTGDKNKVSIYCKKCEEYFEQTPSSHKQGRGCSYCCGQKVGKKNMVSVVRPDLVKYFVNIEEANNVTLGSGKIVRLICPNCKEEKETQVKTLVKQGLSCSNCSDGISMPEKFCIAILKQLNIDFKKEKVFEWSNNRRYDFYIESLNMIIETHGGQHYKKTSRTELVEVQKNDILKEKLAKENGIENYIVIDCRQSSFEWLREEFNNSLFNIFNLSNINWSKIWNDTQKTLAMEIWDAWNNKKEEETVSSLVKTFDMNKGSIIDYLKQGTILNKCSYNPKEEQEKSRKMNGKKVQQFDLNGTFIQEFISVAEASRRTKISETGINRCCNSKQKTAGNFKWSYLNPPQ